MPHGIIKCEPENEGCDAAVDDVKKVLLEGPVEDPKNTINVTNVTNAKNDVPRKQI